MNASIVWALVTLVIVIYVTWRANRWFTSVVDLKRAQLDSTLANTRVTNMERENAAELDKRTIDERAEKERAQLLLDAAKMRVEAEVAQATIPEKIEQERMVSAARSEALADIARQETALAGNSFSDLMRGYVEYCAKVDEDDVCTLDEWIEGYEFINGNLVLSDKQ